METQVQSKELRHRGARWTIFRKKLFADRYLLIMLLPGLIYYLVFHYIPMYGVTIAFKDFQMQNGVFGSPWAGFKWFREFFSSFFFSRLIRNTLLISLYNLVWGFPIPILFALLLNETRGKTFKKLVQTVSYLPHFMSLVITVGLLTQFLSPIDGVVNLIITGLGGQPINFLNEPYWFRGLYVGSDIWQSFGWNSIIYLAALAGIDQALYEAARIDGASRFRQMLHITLPGISSTIAILLILKLGTVMNVGFEKIILMYNPATYEVADVISTYVYRRGILGSQFSFGAAVGLFNSLINLVLLITVNKVSKKIGNTGLW